MRRVAVVSLAAVLLAAACGGGGGAGTGPADQAPVAVEDPAVPPTAPDSDAAPEPPVAGQQASSASEPSLSAYFEQVAATQDTFALRVLALSAVMATAFDDDAEALQRVRALRGFYTALSQFLSEAIEAHDAIDAPAEAAALHAAFVAAGLDLVRALAALDTQLGRVQTAEHARAVFDQGPPPDFATASSRFNQACLALQAAAGRNNIAADLACEGAP